MSHPWTRRRLWPLVLYGLFLMAGISLAAYVFETGAMPPSSFTIAMSFTLGQFALAILVGGLAGRTWIAGWLLGVTLVTAGTLHWQLTLLAFYRQEFSDGLIMIAFWPALLLAGCGPFFVMRALRGWSLTWSGKRTVVRQRPRLEDLFLLSIVVACSISLSRVVSRSIPGFYESWRVVFILALFSGFSAMFVLPAVAITFRAKIWKTRLLGWSGVALAAALACVAINVLSVPTSLPPQLFQDVLIGILSASVTMGLGAWALLASGAQLTRYAPLSDRALESKIDESQFSRIARREQRAQREMRVLAGALLFITLMVGCWMSYMDHQQLQFLQSVQNFDDEPANLGSTLSIKDGKIFSLQVGPSTTDADLTRFVKMQDIQRLSLAHSQVTDNIIAELVNFPELRFLDLSDTQITDVGLERLQKTFKPGRFTELSVAKTRVSFHKALEVAREMRISDLDISDLGIDDAALQERIDLGSITSLALRNNAITDQSLSHLLPARLHSLDLSNTPIDGSGLASINCPPKLILDGTNLSDANFTAILTTNPGIKISIKRTGITAQAIKTAGTTQASIMLGGGAIKDQDLAKLGPLSFNSLGLNGKEFTGACFASANIHAYVLDLSHSGVTDANCVHLKNANNFLSYLNLSHTDVTDSVLATIEQLQCYQLDLRHTKVTAQGLMRSNLPYTRLMLTHDQFTPSELNALRERFNITIDERDNPWDDY